MGDVTESESAAGALRELQPVHELADREPTARTGLCLSGGGYRAMLFHLGALWRLNEAGLLRGIDRVSSVSGGSITAATLGLRWQQLAWDGDVASNLEPLVVAPVRALARRTIDVRSVLGGLLPFTTIGRRVAQAYREHLFGDATLQALPADDDPARPAPRFVICATNLESGVLFRFSRPFLADYRVGMVRDPQVPLADAVAASSAFPPVLSPFEIDLRSAAWTDAGGNRLKEPRWRGRIKLSDGGVYDNLGLEAVWKNCERVLISDGGGRLLPDDDPPSDWARQTDRVLRVIDGQVRALRKRQAIGGFASRQRRGTYWGIRSRVASYGLDDPLGADPGVTRDLAETPTRLAALDDARQERLVNWGYAISDTALRRWVDQALPRPMALPYPARPLA